MLWGALVVVLSASCRRAHTPSTPSSERVFSPLPAGEAVSPLPQPKEEFPSRLSLNILPGEFTLAPAPVGLSTATLAPDDALDSLHNLAVCPEDLENGWNWAWDVFRHLPPGEREGFLDQVASLTPPWAWGRLDPILMEPAWGTEVLQTLWRRLLDLPTQVQLPRLFQIVQTPGHPCRDQAASLLQAYFPEVPPGDTETYRKRIFSPASPEGKP